MHLKISRSNFIIFFTIIFLFLGQKLALSIAGFEFSIAMFVYPLFAVEMILMKEFCIDSKLIAKYVVILLFVICSTSFQNNISYPSLIYFFLIYFFLCLRSRLSNRHINYAVNLIRKILFVSAVIGIIQFMVQFVGIPYFDPYDYLPDNLLLSGFNNYYAISYGSHIMKANGWFYLEPSFFSQFMGLAIILETVSFQKDRLFYVRIVVFLVAMICSFSGTGIIVLLIGSIPAFLKLSNKRKIVLLVALGLVVAIFLNTDYSRFIVGRMGELSNSNLSGAIRFINPYKVVLSQNLSSLVWGSGAGQADSISGMSSLVANNNVITKIILEYGVIVLVLFLSFIISKFFSRNYHIVSVCLFIMFVILSGNLLQPSMVYLLVFINQIYMTYIGYITNKSVKW